MAKEMIIEKTVSINRNINEVFNYLKQTKNQDNFSEWNMKDPGIKKNAITRRKQAGNKLSSHLGQLGRNYITNCLGIMI